jgi:ribosomal protein S4
VLDGKRVHKLAAGEHYVIAYGTNQGLTQSRSHSRLSSDRRSDQSGKISRQQSAAQLQQLLGGRERESGKLKSNTDKFVSRRA